MSVWVFWWGYYYSMGVIRDVYGLCLMNWSWRYWWFVGVCGYLCVYRMWFFGYSWYRGYCIYFINWGIVCWDIFFWFKVWGLWNFIVYVWVVGMRRWVMLIWVIFWGCFWRIEFWFWWRKILIERVFLLFWFKYSDNWWFFCFVWGIYYWLNNMFFCVDEFVKYMK